MWLAPCKRAPDHCCPHRPSGQTDLSQTSGAKVTGVKGFGGGEGLGEGPITGKCVCVQCGYQGPPGCILSEGTQPLGAAMSRCPRWFSDAALCQLPASERPDELGACGQRPERASRRHGEQRASWPIAFLGSSLGREGLPALAAGGRARWSWGRQTVARGMPLVSDPSLPGGAWALSSPPRGQLSSRRAQAFTCRPCGSQSSPAGARGASSLHVSAGPTS